MTDYIESKPLSWRGQLQRMKEEQPVRQMWELRIRTKSGRGRPQKSWDNAVTKLIIRRIRQHQKQNK